MIRNRRSGRIAKELPIVLMGTDTLGKVFAEQTHTVVLSRHGAGIVSSYKFAPDEVLTLRMPGTQKEADVRLVGQIGGEAGRYTYGVAFVDEDLEFWPMEFPRAEEAERAVEQVEFECGACQQTQKFAEGEIEEDVYNVNGFVLRFCQPCGTTTRWKKAERTATVRNEPTRTAAAQELRRSASDAATVVPAASSSAASKTPGAATLVAPPDAPEPLLPMADLPQAAPALARLAAPPSPEAQPTANASGPSLDAHGRRINRRRHVRVKVNFSACVRHPAYDDEIVQCENVSKGGVCFQSKRQYSTDSRIEIAAPYASGEPLLFAAARIVRIEELPEGKRYRYGTQYLK